MSREAWRDFICSSEHAGRHLSGIGRSFAGSVSDPIDQAALRAFLDRLHGATSDVRLLGDVVDLINGGYLQFVAGPLPRILDALSSERLSREEIVGPGLRGNPRWDRTIIGRLSGVVSPAHFVSRTSHRSFELPENLVLAWLVNDIRDRVASVEKRIKTASMHPSLLTAEAACNAAFDHDWFGGLPKPSNLTSDMTSAARGHRRPEYREAARLALRSSELKTNDQDAWWYAILSLLAVNWLEPVDDDDLFELFVLVLTLDVLSVEVGLGEPVEYGLVTTRRGRVALFQGEDSRVEVYFDQTPASVLGIRTAYGDTVRAHIGLAAAERRPDLMIVVESDAGRKLVLVEAKKTSDGRYMSDSVYKVFGYVHDFQNTGTFQTEGVLVVPTGVALASVSSGNPPIYVASGDDRSGLGVAIKSAMQFGKKVT
ncbi:MAG TPA: hypothetical protein ENH55_23505 [Aurantimonas coralicida]|uniref:Uncharacterized protein n=2 Tax=root TaxID=1 RepID=A0A9C9NDR5_9HYPH|nr:hypothetical protein [Aurantimonas coralicida]HEU00200.1 hypothetical protein [Aurantimonas coralicida]